MIEVIFTGSLAEIHAEMRQMLAADVQMQSSAPMTVAPKATKEKPAKEKVAEPAPVDAPADAVTFDDVKKVISSLLNGIGKPKLIEFLATFDGAKRGSEIKEARYPEFIAKAHELLS